jgi:hypothetical protein
MFGFLCSLHRDILSVVGSGVPKICNAFEENAAKRTPNTEFSKKKNLTTKRYLTFKQTIIETCIEIGLKIKELLVQIPSELHMC